MRPLILMPCSATKLVTPAPAHQLYIGPMWQTFHTHRRAIPMRDVFVLSGKYGFVSAAAWLEPYEKQMTKQLADLLIAHHLHDVARYVLANVSRYPFDWVISAGAGEYRRVFEALVPVLQHHGVLAPNALRISQVRGGIGEQRHQLGRWLREANETEVCDAASA